MNYSSQNNQVKVIAGANKDHSANNQWGSFLPITNQKCARNVKRTIQKKSDMAPVLIDSVEPFAIVSWKSSRLSSTALY